MSELRDFDRANELQVEVQKITISELQKRIVELEGAKSHMDYCRTLVPLEDCEVLADGIVALKKRNAELDSDRDSWRQQCEDRVQDVLRLEQRVRDGCACPCCTFHRDLEMEGGAK